jgi:hypothetical protein
MIPPIGAFARITAQLIRASPDKHLWAPEYERDAADVLKLEAEIARTIGQEIRAHLTPGDVSRLASVRSINAAAQEAYLLGRQIVLYCARTYDDAIAQLKPTLELEPRNTAAILMMGVTYEAMGKPQEALAVWSGQPLLSHHRLARNDSGLTLRGRPVN